MRPYFSILVKAVFASLLCFPAFFYGQENKQATFAKLTVDALGKPVCHPDVLALEEALGLPPDTCRKQMEGYGDNIRINPIIHDDETGPFTAYSGSRQNDGVYVDLKARRKWKGRDSFYQHMYLAKVEIRLNSGLKASNPILQRIAREKQLPLTAEYEQSKAEKKRKEQTFSKRVSVEGGYARVTYRQTRKYNEYAMSNLNRQLQQLGYPPIDKKGWIIESVTFSGSPDDEQKALLAQACEDFFKTKAQLAAEKAEREKQAKIKEYQDMLRAAADRLQQEKEEQSKQFVEGWEKAPSLGKIHFEKGYLVHASGNTRFLTAPVSCTQLEADFTRNTLRLRIRDGRKLIIQVEGYVMKELSSYEIQLAESAANTLPDLLATLEKNVNQDDCGRITHAFNSPAYLLHSQHWQDVQLHYSSKQGNEARKLGIKTRDPEAGKYYAEPEKLLSVMRDCAKENIPIMKAQMVLYARHSDFLKMQGAAGADMLDLINGYAASARERIAELEQAVRPEPPSDPEKHWEYINQISVMTREEVNKQSAYLRNFSSQKTENDQRKAELRHMISLLYNRMHPNQGFNSLSGTRPEPTPAQKKQLQAEIDKLKAELEKLK
jgi:hypothetical protein